MQQIAEEKLKLLTAVPVKLQRIIEHLQGLHEDNFTGYIKINYTQGSIGRVEKFEEILKK